MPEALSEEARVVWARVVATAAEDVILAADEFGLEAFSNAVVMYRRAMSLLETAGPLVKGRRGGIVINPAHRAARDWQTVALAWSRELGLSPSARSSLIGRQDRTSSGVEAILGPSPRDLVRAGLGADWGIARLNQKPS
jgi:P27 family predicted phage terminase small subunit